MVEEIKDPADILRCTGRTTRMMMHAVKLAMEGKRVLVVVWRLCHGEEWANRLYSFIGPPAELHLSIPRVALKNGGVIEFLSAGNKIVDVENLTVRGAGQADVLFDHFVLEELTARLRKEIHRFDR